MSQNVYVVIDSFDNHPLGVFSTEKKARKFMDKVNFTFTLVVEFKLDKNYTSSSISTLTKGVK